MNIDADTLIRLYYTEGKTLQEIGKGYGVTRQRVKQVMEKFGIPCITKRSNPHPDNHMKYDTIDDYLAGHRVRGRGDTKVMRRFLDRSRCSECGSTRNVDIHHINYPATSVVG